MKLTLLILQENGNICEKEVTLTAAMLKKEPSKIFTAVFCKKIIDSIGSGKITQGKGWTYQGKRLIPVGYQSPSEDINPNSHVLPGDDSNPYFGDIIMYSLEKDKKLVDITEELYEEFYAASFEDVAMSSEEENNFELSGNEEEVPSDIEDKIDYGEEEEEVGESEVISKEDEETYIENWNLTDKNELVVEQDEEEPEDTLIPEDGLKDTEYSTDVRAKVIKKVDELLDNNELSSKIEESIIQFSKDKAIQERIPRNWDNELFRKIYLNKARSLYTNLDTNSYVKNPNFKKKILSGKIKPQDIPGLTFQQVFPEHWKKLMDEKYKKEKMLYEEKQEAMTTQYKCGRCKSRKCTYYELQTRSADESMTIFITCINCGNRWKQ